MPLKGAVQGCARRKEVLQSRLDAYISELGAAGRNQTAGNPASLFPTPGSPHCSICQIEGCGGFTFVSGTFAVWAALLLGIGPPAVLGPSLAALLLPSFIPFGPVDLSQKDTIWLTVVSGKNYPGHSGPFSSNISRSRRGQSQGRSTRRDLRLNRSTRPDPRITICGIEGQ